MTVRSIIGCGCCLGLLAVGGCGAVPAAAGAGAVLGLFGTAVSDGSAVYHFGKLEFAANATTNETRDAIERAIGDVELTLDAATASGPFLDEAHLYLHDRRKNKYEVHFRRRTDRLCDICIDVGWFGSEPAAKLIMERVRDHLPKTVSLTAGS